MLEKQWYYLLRLDWYVIAVSTIWETEVTSHLSHVYSINFRKFPPIFAKTYAHAGTYRPYWPLLFYDYIMTLYSCSEYNYFLTKEFWDHCGIKEPELCVSDY